MDGALFGRDRELEAGRTFLEDAHARGLVIEGAAGIGKTAVWHALLDTARTLGCRVLACIGESAEARLAFVGLGDLLGEAADDVLPSLPSPQARALEVALLRVDAAGTPSEPLAVAAAVLSALRLLSSSQPVVVAIDDLPWLDRASADAVAFAARRLRGAPVRFLLTRRHRSSSALERALTPGIIRLEVGGLSLGAIRRVLADQAGLTVSRQLLRRIYDTTLGNPLFALEVGRMLVEQGLPVTGADLPVPETVDELLGTRLNRLSPAVRTLLLAVALNGELALAQLRPIASAETLDDAIERGLVRVTGGRIRVSHPLVAAAAKQRSRARERRELHLILAETMADETLRAHHAALATSHPDPEVAAIVAAAAAKAFARGARTEAVELGEHAVRLTPTGSADGAERLLALGSYLETAGELERLRALLMANFESIPPGPPRARAWLLLSEGAHMRLADYRQLLERALAEAQTDPGLRARIVAWMSSALISVERIAEAEARTLAVLPAAIDAGPEVERDVLFALAWARALRGQPLDDICQRWASAAAAPGHLAESPERVAGQRSVWRGEINEARAMFDRLLVLSDERGELASYVWARLHLCELALRVGDWQTAERLLDEWAETSERELFVEPYYQRCRALLAAGRGLPDDTMRWSAEAIAQAQAIDHQWDWLESLRARGMAALLTREPQRAADSLKTVWEHTCREGVDEPGVFPVAPDLVEALVELHELDNANAVTARLDTLSEQQQHPWGLLTARRCRALISLAAPQYDEAAANEFKVVATSYGRLGLDFDQARSLLAVGTAQRRLKQWGAARRSLEEAVETFDQIGSMGWGERARSELDRVGARRPGREGQLTPSEKHVAELAAAGHSNKQIAQALFITIKTVEGHLSRAYAKLGVTSRAQLTHRLQGQQSSGAQSFHRQDSAES
ncbi:MAG TPA: LuxR C-terminal-related transcriptional regulator [Solirubrobacteraceae bacterium]|nr:LuxR C-terminal-related transcriptional regulator [Solirubrobacteraceae bacterium]